MIKAPFNFVPLSDKVFTPNWANDISHDIPFEDGESGEIELKITAHSPIFVRNGHTSSDGEIKNENYKSFSKIDDKYFIPGTSIKGAIRNVLEIMSFGKMSQIQNSRFAFRDLNSIQYNLKNDQDNILCGWLIKKDNDFYIENCGKPIWIRHDQIDRSFNVNFVNAFKKGGFATIGRTGEQIPDSKKTAKYKYENLLKDIENFNFKYSIQTVQGKQYARSGSQNGILVVTGQPMVRTQKRDRNGEFRNIGKFKEFIFPAPSEKIANPETNDKFKKINSELWDEFLFQYFDSDPNKISTDWKYWKLKQRNQKSPIPVFFRLERNEIKDFGLTFLYKLPYRNKVKDLLPRHHKDTQPDLSELIFGAIGEKSLKGRVQIRHAYNINSVQPLKEEKALLSSPRASYYPFYLLQRGSDGLLAPWRRDKTKGIYQTYMDDTILSGWKRYPIHQKIPFTETTNQQMITKFIPLNQGAEFKCKVRFHNLRKTEIGALISSITFHNNPSCYHSLGMAKPYGYGKVSFSIEKLNYLNHTIPEYLKAFENLMNENLFDSRKEWHTQEQIKELFTMASLNRNNRFASSIYMSLNEFSSVKGSDSRYNPQRSEYLQHASRYYQYSKIPDSYSDLNNS